MLPAADRVESILAAAVEIGSDDERRRYVEEACGGDAQLYRRVEELIDNHLKAGSFLEPHAADPAATVDAPVRDVVGALIGPYKLLEQIGEGGFGTVFMAEQSEPVRRKVALKVLKPGMDSRQVVARFEAERQALALMDHPHIARVFDGGQTSAGRPYFVMELVRGAPITDFCDRNHLSVQERLELFIDICQAVQHAHHKGIIHRDIKPSNVLVTLHDTRPVVKVIDFGIAKALEQPLTEKTLFTGFAQMIGTPLYMSPEQAQLSGLDVDTRSDVYSLGVLLYELLTGTTPFDRERLRHAGFDEMRRIIREEEPAKPSTRLSTQGKGATTASANRQSDPRRLSRLFKGELDWVVMKALEKDRSRRYESAAAFAQDVQRYLDDEPVLACPPSAGYRLRKFVRRHRGPVLAAAALLLLLVAGTVGTTAGMFQAQAQEQKTRNALNQVTAEQAKTQAALRSAREALDTLTGDVVQRLLARQPELEEQEKAFLRKVLGLYEGLTEQLGDTAEARFLRAKGTYQVAYLRELLGEQRRAEEDYRAAIGLLGGLAEDFPDEPVYREKLGQAHENRGVLIAELGDPEGAEKAIRKSLELREALAGDPAAPLRYEDDLSATYHDLAILLQRRGGPEEAEKTFRRALKVRERLAARPGAGPNERRALARTRAGLAGLLREERSRLAEAERLYHQAIKDQQELVDKSPDAPRLRRDLADGYHGLGIALAEGGKDADAETALRKAVELREKLKTDFPGVRAYRRELANTESDLGRVLMHRGERVEAEKVYRRTLEAREKLVAQPGAGPADHQELARNLNNLAALLASTGRHGDAAAAAKKALGLYKRLTADHAKVGDYHNETARTLFLLAKLRFLQRDVDAALRLLEEARPHLRAALDASPKSPLYRQANHDNLQAAMLTLFEMGDHARLAAAAEELARFGFEPASDSYDAARCLARCAAWAEKGPQLDAGRRQALTRDYTDRALALLGQAIAHGFHDATHLQRDGEFEPLRSRDEYRKLLAELEAKKNR